LHTIGVVSTMTPLPDLPFSRLGEWDVLAPIAEGGMAQVYLGRATEDAARFAALKVIRPELSRNKGFVAMFLDEGRIATRVSHPSLATVYGVGHDGKRHFLAMELLRGRTLLELWKALQDRGERLPVEAAAWIGEQLAAGLDHLHGIASDDGKPLEAVHRDVNPANVFITYDGEAKLIDFGLAKAHDRIASTAAGIVKGKLAYLSPEQAQGRPADRRADVFALGVVLWELTVDQRLFKQADDAETVRRVRAAEVPDPAELVPGYPRAFADIVLRALARDPEARYQSARELAQDLDAFVRGSGRPFDARALAAKMAELFPRGAAPPWERFVDDRGRVRVWDDDAKKMTWLAVSIETALPAGALGANGGPAPETPPPQTLAEQLDAMLAARLAAVDPKEDPVGAARVHLERALVDELLGDGTRAAAEVEASLRAEETVVAHTALRRLRHSRATPRELLPHLDAEIAASASDAARADLLAERARVLDASGETLDVVREAWARALAASPAHTAALKGLEGALSTDERVREALATHVGQLAEAYGAEPKLAARLHVERAEILERALDQGDAAKAALERALAIDAGLGPVRDACVLFAVVHRDSSWLEALLASTAELEADPARAAGLLLDAACVVRRRAGDQVRAAQLLESAAAKASSSRLVPRRVVDELVELYEAGGRADDALRARRMRLALLGDARSQAHELRAIAVHEEARGDRAAATEALERARALSEHDATLLEELDRLLASASRESRRVAMWAQAAARVPAGPRRADVLLRAAQIAESLGDVPAAVEHLRSALVSHPEGLEAVDRLCRLLASPAGAAQADEARARIAVHTHAAEHALDPARRVAHLEAVALLAEEALFDPALAASTFERILELDPGRRTALIGLARAAARAGDSTRLAAALLEEAKAAPDGDAADDLRVRAAEALARTDADRALSLAHGVLARRPDHARARRVEQSIHEAGGRWAKVDESMAARIEHAADPREALDLWMARAELQRARLRAPRSALASVREAVARAGDHPALRDALPSLLAEVGDPRAARDTLVELAASAASSDDRARDLVRAAEIDELVLEDDDHAAELLERAQACCTDPWIAERSARVAARRARHDGAASAVDPARAASVAEEELARDPSAVHALRSLERAAREQRAYPLLANALLQEADAFAADAPKLGALWAAAALVEWKLPAGDASPMMLAILARAPLDRAALDTLVRTEAPKMRGGDAAARDRLATALAARLTLATDDTTRALERLALAMVFETDSTRTKEALDQYREAVRADGRSPLAAAGCARLGARLGDAAAQIAGAAALSELVTSDKDRAKMLVHAAGQILGSNDPSLGSRAERLARAAEWLERALDADPEAIPAVGLLVATRTEQRARDRLLGKLRELLERAQAPDAVVLLGAEVARVACSDPPDRVLAIDALRRVRAASPADLKTLRLLADLYLAQHAWGEAAEALESLVSHAREPQAKIPALFDLAELYGKSLEQPDAVERVLRAVLDADPANVRALRALVTQRREAAANAGEIATLLTRLADAERSPAGKSAALLELAASETAAGDGAAAERALIEAAALSPSAASLARVLALHAGAPAEQARSLEALVARGQALERVEAMYVAALGQLEVDALGRYAEGAGHLRVALALAPAMHEARAALAKGLVQIGKGGDALGALLPMIGESGPAAILALRDPASALSTLERGLAQEGRPEEALVARELRAVAGGLDDGAHVELRARRLVEDPSLPAPVLFDRALLLDTLAPREAQGVLLDVGAALSGIEAKLVRTDVSELALTPRDVVNPASGHPAMVLAQRIARAIGVALPPIAVSEHLRRPRVAILEPATWLLLPTALFELPQPVQVAAIARAVTRVALGVPWTEELRADYVHAILLAAVQHAVPELSLDGLTPDQRELVDEYGRRIKKAIGRKQKKALAVFAPQLATSAAPTLADVEAMLLAVRRTELRAAFVLTGDLLATLDDLRADDPAFAQLTSAVGPNALRATLEHPLASDVARFALGAAATSIRWRAGTLWMRRS
jgi:hypothetical protein